MMRLLLAALALIGVAGCVSTTTTSTTAGDSRGPREIVTASDQTDPDKRARVRLELAAAYFGRGQGTTALDEVKLAIAAKPDMPEAYNLRGLIYAGLGEAVLAEESFQRALQLNARDADTMHNYGFFLCQQRRFPEADRQFDAALAQPQYRDTSRTLLAQGICQARGGLWVQAERTLVRSYELDPANPTTAFNLSDVLYRRGEYERARFYIGRVNANPDLSNAQTLWLAARIERRLGNTGALQNLGRQLRDRFPQSPEALNFDSGRFDE